MKLPSQKRILYETGTVGYNAWSGSKAVNLPKDLSIMNRRGFTSTDNKGVPQVFLCQIDLYRVNNLTTPDGLTDLAHAQDFSSAISVGTVANNWATKNAAIKWHAARASMWEKAGVKKAQLGAYTNAIRYNWDAANDTYYDPVNWYGVDFAGGTWDASVFADGLDQDWQLKLIGTGTDQSAATTSITALNFVHSYLQSRATVPFDSNLESNAVPAAHSHLLSLMREGFEGAGTTSDDVITDVKTGQDNPPYDDITPSDTANDITEAVEAGRAIIGIGGSGHASIIVEIPFGIFQPKFTHFDSDTTNEVAGLDFAVTVLDIYPMQG